MDLFFFCADILVYVSLVQTKQIWEQAPNKFHTSSRQVPDKFCFQTCPRVVQKSNLSTSCPHLHRNLWVLYWTSSSCPKTKLVRELSGVFRHLTTIGQVPSYQTSFIAGCCASCRRAPHIIHHNPQPSSHTLPISAMPSKATKNWGHTPSRLGYAPPY